MFKQIENADLYLGDCVAVMQSFQTESVDLTVTSPPYDSLRTYAGTLKWDFETFKQVANELYRITKDGGVVVWVVGDKTVKGSETLSSFKQAIYFNEIGFNVHDTMIYKKANPIPQNHNRYEQCFEYMFVFSKGKPNTFNPLKETTKNAGKEFNWGDRKVDMDPNQCRRHRETDIRKVPEFKTKKNIFEYSVGGGKTGHPAVFPEKLAEDHILSWSNEGDIVFDPFMGSATTGKMAILNNRNFIGIEKVPEYFEISEKRISSLIR